MLVSVYRLMARGAKRDKFGTMSDITTNNQLLTVINVFTVAPANQARLVGLLVQATAEVMKNLPGFISANIHQSDDGTRVVNYAQWRSRADFESMMKNPSAQKHMRGVTDIAKVDPHWYRVSEVIEAHAA